MSIPYLQSGNSITAAHWAAIIQQADALLTSALGGFSAVFAGVDKQWDRCFFFFDPSTTLPANLHPLAATWLANSAVYGPPSQSCMFYRLYNDSAISGVISGLSPTATSSKYGVAKITQPTWATWSAAVYPHGFAGSMNYTVLYNPVNALDISLKIWTDSTTGYALTYGDATTAEHAQPFKPVDIFINGTFTWSSTWNKYSIVRIHNCAITAATVTLGTLTQPLGAGASLCVRNVGGSWIACGNYFHWMESGDGRFLQCVEATGGASPLFNPGIVADILQTVLTLAIGTGTSNVGGYYNASQFWDLSPIYNNASYAPTAFEKTPPSGGYLAALTGTSLLGDLIVIKGKNVVAHRDPATPSNAQFTFAGFATLASALSGASVNTRAVTQTVPAGQGGSGGGTSSTVINLEIYDAGTTGSYQQALFDISSDLVTFITGGNPVGQYGTSQSSTPKSMVLPQITLYAAAVTGSTTTSTARYYAWAVDGNGNPYQAGMVTVTITNAGSTAGQSGKVFLATDTASTAESWITTTGNAGGVISISGFQILSTPFGPILTWVENWPLNAQFTSVYKGPANTFILSVTYQQGLGLFVTRARFLADGFGIWPGRTGSSTFMPWNFARVDQLYTFQRFFLHPTADAPMMPNWTGSFQGSNYSCEKYVSSPWGDTISTAEYVPVKAFYENTPIGVDTTLTPSTLQTKTGISRMGPFIIGSDDWPLFCNWYRNAGNLTYAIPPDLTGNTGIVGSSVFSIPTGGYGDWASRDFGAVYPTASPAQVTLFSYGLTSITAWQNVLPCQVEHINTLASLVNTLPPMRKVVSGSYGTFTLNFAAANILIVSGGSGYQVGDQVGPFNLQVASVDGNGAILTVIQSSGASAVVNTYYTNSTPARPFALSGGHGSGATVDTSSGTACTPFVPAYAPIAVPVPTGGPWPITGGFWPRNAYFAWNGPSIAGAADPVGTYLASLGAGLQATLPDAYGTPIFETYLCINSAGGASPTALTSYYGGFTPAFQTAAAAYRWITIDDARALYASLSLPFVLNGVYAPMAFKNTLASANVTTTTQNVTSTVTYEVRTNGSGPPPFTIAEALAFVTMPPGSIWSDTTDYTAGPDGSSSPSPALDGTWNNAGFHIALLSIAGFINNAAGNWLTSPASPILRASIKAVAPYLVPALGGTTQMLDSRATLDYEFPGTPGYIAYWGGAGYTPYTDATSTSNGTGYIDFSVAVHTNTLHYTLDYGVLDVIAYPFGVPGAYTALTILSEGMPAQLAAAIPQNYYYYDPNWVANNTAVYNALGTGVIPIIADNSVEGDATEVTLISGAGGSGLNDHTVTTHLGNARLVTIPIDQQTGNQQTTGAGNTANTGAGADAPSGAGGGGGTL